MSERRNEERVKNEGNKEIWMKRLKKGRKYEWRREWRKVGNMDVEEREWKKEKYMNEEENERIE